MVSTILRKVADLIEEDHDHMVVIKKTYDAGKFLDPVPPDFKCPDFRIKDGELRIYKTGKRKPIVDGASCAPDKVGGIDIANGYIIHDFFYHYMTDLAKAWDCPEKEVRALADAVLANAIEQEGGFLAKVVSRVYYSAVRVFGGIYHSIRKLFLSVLVIVSVTSLFAGCGCQAPHVFEVEEDAEYQVVKGGAE